MKINSIKNNNVNFNGIYFTKFPILTEKEMYNIKAIPNHFAIEERPLEITKEIMKSSKLFRDLDNSGTDMFVYMGTDSLKMPNENYKNNNELLGVLYTKFVNPYTKKCDTLSIQADGFSRETIFEKIKEVADNLPYINELKENLWGKPRTLRTSDQWMIAYNK